MKERLIEFLSRLGIGHTNNHQHNEIQNNSGIVGIQGDGSQITNGSNEHHETYLEMLRKKDEQIDKLLEIIKKIQL